MTFDPIVKKVVHYDPSYPHTRIEVGYSADVKPIDHPDADRVSNTMPVWTSTVIEVREDGEFETMNTIYRPMLAA